jgi:hypothetical protein
VVWLEIAERQYIGLPDPARDLADHLLAGLEQSPTNMSGAVYNHTSDQWSAPLGDQGFVFYAVLEDHATVIILRVIHIPA